MPRSMVAVIFRQYRYLSASCKSCFELAPLFSLQDKTTKGNKREREARHGTTVVLCVVSKENLSHEKHLRHLSFGTIKHTHFECTRAVAHTRSTHLLVQHRQPSAGPFAAVAPWLRGSVFLYVTDFLPSRVVYTEATGEILTDTPIHSGLRSYVKPFLRKPTQAFVLGYLYVCRRPL